MGRCFVGINSIRKLSKQKLFSSNSTPDLGTLLPCSPYGIIRVGEDNSPCSCFPREGWSELTGGTATKYMLPFFFHPRIATNCEIVQIMATTKEGLDPVVLLRTVAEEGIAPSTNRVYWPFSL